MKTRVYITHPITSEICDTYQVKNWKNLNVGKLAQNTYFWRCPRFWKRDKNSLCLKPHWLCSWDWAKPICHCICSYCNLLHSTVQQTCKIKMIHEYVSGVKDQGQGSRSKVKGQVKVSNQGKTKRYLPMKNLRQSSYVSFTRLICTINLVLLGKILLSVKDNMKGKTRYSRPIYFNPLDLLLRSPISNSILDGTL